MARDYQRTADGKRYMSQPRHPVTGKRITITADTVAELNAKVARVRDVRTDMRLGESVNEAERRLSPVLGTRMTVDEAWSRYEAGLDRSREKGKSVWERRLAPWFSGKTIWELTADVMRQWEAEQRRAGYALATVGLAYDMLAAAINLQVPAIVPGLPWGKWRPERESKDELYTPKRPAVGNLETFASLVQAAANDDAKAWRRARYSVNARLVVFLGMCGLRQGEAAGLGWDHVSIDDESNDVLFVEWQAARGWQTRHADRPRDVPKDGSRRIRMHPAVVKLLLDQRAELIRRGWYRQDGPVWPGPGGKWLETGRVLAPPRIKKWAHNAGLPRWEEWCAHSLRHSNIMLEIQAHGGDLMSVMRRSGHSDLRVMRGYMHAMGGLLPPSKIGLSTEDARTMMPSLEGTVVTVGSIMSISDRPAVPLLDASGAVSGVTALLAIEATKREETVEERALAKRERKERADDSLEVVFRRWDAAGRPGEKPPEIVERARRAYMKGYNQALRKRKPADACKAEGKLARGRFLGAWSLAVKRMSRMTTPPQLGAPEAAQ